MVTGTRSLSYTPFWLSCYIGRNQDKALYRVWISSPYFGRLAALPSAALLVRSSTLRHGSNLFGLNLRAELSLFGLVRCRRVVPVPNFGKFGNKST